MLNELFIGVDNSEGTEGGLLAVGLVPVVDLSG